MSGIRSKYEKYGVDNYYKKFADEYNNPHFNFIKELLMSININKETKALDLCCGSGEVTRVLASIGADRVTGCDPYMHNIYHENTGKEVFTHDFKKIAEGALSNCHFDVIICSFALHLCEQSMLPAVLYQLSSICDELIIISPHKRPVIGDDFFRLIEKTKIERVYMKRYESKMSKLGVTL